MLWVVLLSLFACCCNCITCKYPFRNGDSLESISQMFNVDLSVVEKVNEKITLLKDGVEVVIPNCIHLPVCTRLGEECDISWQKEDVCVKGSRKRATVFVSCSVVGQICSSFEHNSCHAEISRCGDPCKEASIVGSCGELAFEPKRDSLYWPVPSSFSVIKKFGEKDGDSSCGFHTAVDIAAEERAAIVAIASGRVVHVGNLWVNGKGYGRGDHAIVIQHGKGFYSVYSHNRSASVSKGVCVEGGQIIGEIGSEGFAKGISHLHVEILQGSTLKFSGNWAVPFDYSCLYYKNLMEYFKDQE